MKPFVSSSTTYATVGDRNSITTFEGAKALNFHLMQGSCALNIDVSLHLQVCMSPTLMEAQQ